MLKFSNHFFFIFSKKLFDNLNHIYLLKFLEFIESHYPGQLASYFNQDIFVYANVPYKIKSYKDETGKISEKGFG